jgi:hypothetical protein
VSLPTHSPVLIPNTLDHRAAPVYLALSYTWGSLADGVDIWLDGQRIRVTRNLTAALQVFRADENARQHLLWIDALCINQNDIAERSCQVKRMIDIYRRASFVLVWLGPESNDSAMAFGIIETIYEDMIERLNKGDQQPYFTYNSLSETGWMALCNLLDRPYWNRIWIVQELAAGHPVDILVCCGKHSVMLDQVLFSLKFMGPSITNWEANSGVMRDADWKIKMPRLLLNRLPLLKLAGTVTAVPAGEESETEGPSFEMLLMTMKHAVATDPRDMVYGLLGLHDARVVASITPDYSLPVARVYADFTKAIIMSRGDLSVIYSYGVGVTQPGDWPSWVPDFRDMITNAPSPISEKGFSAGGAPRAVSFSGDGMTLICQGVLVDELEDTWFGPFSDSINKFDERIKADLRQALRRILIEATCKGGQYPVPPLISLADLTDPGCEDDGIRAFMRRNEATLLKGVPLRQWILELEKGKARPVIDAPRRKAELNSISSWLWHRALVTTKAGRFGLATNMVKEGDRVAIVLGCNMPLLLRPSAQALRVVGACYIDGLMDGEALRDPGLVRRLETLRID